MTLRILLTGANGQLGREIQKTSCNLSSDASLTALDRHGLDITRHGAVENAIRRHRPEVVVNAAAYTAVDKAETEQELAFAVNRDGAENLAGACAKAGIPLIHVSTDYVFDGQSSRPYLEEDPISPLNVYGRSKAEGEERIRAVLDEHVILRTSWLYAPYGRNFLTTMLRLGLERETISVVNDQKGCPTSVRDLSSAILSISHYLNSINFPWGTFHFCNAGNATWYDFAEAIFSILASSHRLKVSELIPISSEMYQSKAIRPQYSALDCSLISSFFGIHQNHWKSSLVSTLDSIDL